MFATSFAINVRGEKYRYHKKMKIFYINKNK